MHSRILFRLTNCIVSGKSSDRWGLSFRAIDRILDAERVRDGT